MIDRRFFTLEEANAMVPKLARMVEEQLARARDIERRWREIQKEREQGKPTGSQEEELHGDVDAYEAGWRAIEELGAVVKDPRMGLLDFYGTIDGKTVWLCWRYGERAVEHYHAIDEGFAGRKRIAGAVKAHLLN